MRFSLTRMAGAIALILGAAVLAVAGVALWLWSFFLFIARYLPADGAALATGAVTFAGVGVLLWVAKRLNR